MKQIIVPEVLLNYWALQDLYCFILRLPGTQCKLFFLSLLYGQVKVKSAVNNSIEGFKVRASMVPGESCRLVKK